MMGGTDLEPLQGPAHGRPMPLQISQGSEMMDWQDQQEYNGSMTQGKRPQLQRSE
jgi:hypothetical protein